jgi:hypothetical protein
MAGENIERSRGQPRNYKFDRGGSPTEFGPFIGRVTNNIDPTRQGRLQVYIEQFAGPNPDDPSLWRTVSYCPPFYGLTPKGGSAGVGTYLGGNQQSYGMWFTPPDIGVSVMCFFVEGDPNQGFYLGCIPEQGINRMIPAIGSVPTAQAQTQNSNQATYLADAPLLPVTEINNASTATAINENPRFFDQPKPVHSYVAATLFQQGLANDPIRGPIGSSSQRESPSACYGISTPGRAIYQGGLGAGPNGDRDALKELSGETLANLKVIARRGGHTLVMDDGTLTGNDNLIRIRTSKGHQITMSDDGNCFYITHANGQTWIELGQEGTVDVFATNSVNVRTRGTINLHADEDINMFAGKRINIKSTEGTAIQSDGDLNVAAKKELTLFSSAQIGVLANGTLALKGKQASVEAQGSLVLKGQPVDINGAAGFAVTAPAEITNTVMPDTNFNSSTGWVANPTALESIVTRAPTHEPYPYHNQGVSVSVSLEEGQTTPPPATPTVPPGVSITKTADGPEIAPTATSANAATTSGTVASTARPTLAEQQEAQRDMLDKQEVYEKLRAEFGILDPRAEAAFAEYKGALARFQAIVARL